MAGRKGLIAPAWNGSQLVLLLLTLCLAGAAGAEPRRVYSIDIPAEGLAAALNGLSEQTGVSVVFPFDLVKDRKANPVIGHYTVLDALEMLLRGTGLSGGLSERGVLTISESKPGTGDKRETIVTSDTTSPDHQSKRTRRAGLVAFLAGLAAPFSASAEDAPELAGAGNPDAVHMEEVKVTARKREERLQDVPAAIMAASAQTLSDLNIVRVTELNTIAPGFTIVTDPGRFGGGPAVSLRGISTLTQSPAVQDSVGIVIDGIPISRAKAGAFPDMNDVSRVEVLPGPQGTLFGKNATAGVISISTADPGREFAANGDVDYSNYDTIIGRAVVSGPLSDGVLGRASLYYKSQDGFIKNVYDGSHWNDDKQKGARGKLILTPTMNDTIKLSGDFLQENNDAGMQTIRAFLPSTPAYIRTILAPIVGLQNDEIDAHSLGSNIQRVGGGALQWDHTLGSHTLTALAGYRLWTQNSDSATYNWPTPLNGAPGEGGNTFFSVNSHQYSGELRIASPANRVVDYVGGLFIFDDNIASALFDPLPGLLALSSNGTLTGHQQRNWANDTKAFNHAAFGEVNAHVTSHLTLTGGLRWTHEKVDATINGLPTAPGLQRLVVPLGTTVASQSASNVSWRGGGEWRFDEDQMLYITAATGWKGPAFNVVSSIPGNAQPVKPESSTSYEVGWKSQFFDRTVTANFDVYHAIYRDYQTQGFVTLPGTQVATVLLANAAKLKTQGFETELAARVGASTQLMMNAAYIDATYKEYVGAQCYTAEPIGPGQCVNGQQNLSGKRLANTPQWAYNVLVRNDFHLPGTAWTGFATVDYSWRSSIEWDSLGSPYGIEPSYGLLGASLGFESSGSRLGIKFYGKNLTNRFHTEGLLIGQTVSQFLPPDYRRVLGVNVSVRF